MADERSMVQCIGVYDEVNLALRDLDAFEERHREEAIGGYDAAVVDMKDGKPHIVERLDRPRIRAFARLLGSGPLPRDELDEAAKQLPAGEAALIVVGDSTIERAWEKAVTRASKVVMHDFDAATDQIAKDLYDAVGS